MSEGNQEPIGADQFLDDNGMFKEGWLDHLSEDLRDNPTLKTTKDVQGLSSQLVNTMAKIGKDKIVKPGEGAGEDEIAAYHREISGVATVDDYTLKAPDKMPEGIAWSDDLATRVKTAAFESGVSDKALGRISSEYHAFLGEMAEAARTEERLAAEKADQQLHRELGPAYDPKMKAAGDVVRAAAAKACTMTNDESLIKEINELAGETLKGLAYDSSAALMFSALGEVIGEDALIGAGAPPVFTPGEADAKINEITANPYYVSASPAGKPKNQALHDQLIEQVRVLIESKYAK